MRCGVIAFFTSFLVSLAFPSSVAADDPARMTAVRQSINEAFPLVNLLHQKWQAIQIASRTLEELRPNATCRIAAPLIEQELARFVEERANATEKPPGMTVTIRDAGVDFQKQWIALSARLDVAIENPAVQLTIRAGGGAAPALLGRDLRLFLALTSIEIESASAPDAAVLEAALPAVNAALIRAVEQINDAFKRQPFIIPLDLAPIGPLNLSDLAATKEFSEVTSAPITLSYTLRGSAILIDSTSVNLLAEISFDEVQDRPAVAEPAPPSDLTEERVEERYAFLADRFAQLRSAFAGTPPHEAIAWAAISRAVAAEAINTTLASPRLCGTYSLPDSEEQYNLRIDTFQKGEIECSPELACDLVQDTRDCRRERVCERRHDDRGCGRFDFICEAAKGAQNAAYEAEFAACQLTPQFIVNAQCEVEKATANAGHKINHDLCEADKARLKGQCELYKELVKQAQQIANVSGSLKFSGDARLCIDSVRSELDLSAVTVSGSAGANEVNVSGSMRYIPLNISGHLGCPAEWTRDVGAKVQVPAQSFEMRIPLSFGSEGERTLLTYEIGEQTVQAEMHPAPFEAVFVRHPDLVVICPGPAAVLGTATLFNSAYFATQGKALAPELMGKLALKTKAVRQSIAIEPKVTAIGGIPLRLMPRMGEQSIEFVAVSQ